VVADGETGMLVEPGSAAAWRDAVTRLLDDRLSRDMGDRAHADWQSRYSPEQGLADLEEAYGQVTGSALAGRTTQLRGTGLERTGGRRG
jgi:glycosyltransferase involved in cell wall biosynthesis